MEAGQMICVGGPFNGKSIQTEPKFGRYWKIARMVGPRLDEIQAWRPEMSVPSPEVETYIVDRVSLRMGFLEFGGLALRWERMPHSEFTRAAIGAMLAASLLPVG